MVVVVNRHIVQRNRKTGEREKPLRKSNGKYGKPSYCNDLQFTGASGRLRYDPDNPLPCGATVWIEFDEGGFWSKDE